MLQRMLERLSAAAEALSRWSARWIPSALSIALILTVLTFAIALAATEAGPLEVVKAWGSGFFEEKLLAFAMQMAIVMFSGYMVAVSPPVARALDALAARARTPRGAVVLMAASSMLLAFLNWGLSIVGSAMLARFIARRAKGVDYRLLVATAYFGLGATWHAGLSASAPLIVATPGNFLEQRMGGVIPIDRTIFSAFNLGLSALSVVLLCAVAWALHPPPERTVAVDPKLLEGFAALSPPVKPVSPTPAERADHAPFLPWLFGAGAVTYLGWFLASNGWRKLDINTVNFIFLTAGVVLHRTPASLLRAAEEASSVLHGIVLQFPLYFGMYGIFKGTHLAERIGDLFVSVSTARTLPAIVYWYSGVVNYFVPSGGSKWAIEAPYVLDAAQRLGVPFERIVLAYAWGDMATDLIQPFWALPLLAVARLEFKDILGFLLLAFLVYVPVVSVAFLFAF